MGGHFLNGMPPILIKAPSGYLSLLDSAYGSERFQRQLTYPVPRSARERLAPHAFRGSFPHSAAEENLRDCQGPQSLTSNPALTACASERMKPQRFSYFAGFAARELMREAKPVKLEKVAVSHFFDSKKAALAGRPSCVWDIPTGRVLITHEPS